MKEGESSHVKCAHEGSGGKKLRRGGGLVAATSYLKSIPFDLPAHHFEENTSDKWKKLVC